LIPLAVCFPARRCGRRGAVFPAAVRAGPAYRFTRPQSANDSPEFVDFLSAIVNARLFSAGEVEVLNSGAAIYAAELGTIRGAKRSIHLEAYLFLRGRIADEILAALIEARARGRCGATRRRPHRQPGDAEPVFSELRAAGGKVYWYQPIAWYTLKRFQQSDAPRHPGRGRRSGFRRRAPAWRTTGLGPWPTARRGATP